MDERALTALELQSLLQGSIKKWEDIVAGTGEDRGSQNCPLCQEFLDNVDCDGCPVAQRAGIGHCENTPYWAFYDAAGGLYKKADTPELKALARVELDFLKSLLPA